MTSAPRPANQGERAEALRRFQPYPAYKDSGVKWLADIPAHWEVKRLRFVSESNPVPSEVQGLSGDTEVSFVPMELVGEHGGLSLEITKPIAEVKAGYTYFRDGDIVIAKITPCFENGKGALASGLTNGIAFGTTELHVLRPRERVDRRFLFYVTLSDAFRGLGEADMYGAGGQKRVSESFVRNFTHAIPPAPEQRAIAALLDRETARIDALVAKKERLIELLQEQRTALITRAVTKGLDGSVRMKDSGVEWLGEVPAHWESLAISRVTVSRCDGPFGSGIKSEHYSDSGVRVIRLQNIGWTEFLGSDQAYLAKAYATQLGDHSVVAHDLLIAGLGDGRYPVGRACVAPESIEPAMVKADCFRFRLDQRRVLPRFAAYQLSATASVAVGALSTGATRARMNLTTTASRLLALPPIDEQRAIVDALDEGGKTFTDLAARVRDAIDRLKEFRTAIISAAVTGKIDVREKTA